MESGYVLELKGITKQYFGNTVLKNVSIHVKPGEILALVGENGAGKSTLMNVLFGMSVIHSTGGYEGEVLLNGETVKIESPFDAMRRGIGMVHQEFMLVDGYCVAENIKLNRENIKDNLLVRSFGKQLAPLDREKMLEESAQTLDRLGITLSASEMVGRLPVGHKQFVEIARELDKENIQLIVLDEPTAVLTEDEAHQFLECVKAVARKGISFIFISHRLDEVKQYSDRVAIMRDGALVECCDTEAVSAIRISELMVGRGVELKRDKTQEREAQNETVIELKNFSVDMPGEALRNVSFEIKKGEILGFAGLAGHGKAAIANGINGLYPSCGEVLLHGSALEVSDTLHTLEQKLMFVSEDRRGVGLLLDQSIERNITVAAMRVKNRFTRKIAGIRFYNAKAGRKFAEEMVKTFDIRCTGTGQITRRLSGGNQQKVCVARAVSMEPDILFVSEPTRGIDIGAKKRILDALEEMNREKGTTIVIISSELAELRSVCDRIAIITEGRVAGILKPDDADYKFGLLMSGSELPDEREGEMQHA